jgi:LysR family transcriptional regulator, benzoate and cis,cis-muconate-responsive activator of ben and cat genes
VEFRHLRYFVAVAERRNISQAAQQLRIAQPPLSRQIRQLEDEIGATLLVRNKRGVDLTPAGEVFLKQAKKLIADSESAARKARNAQARESAVVKIGIASGLGGVASQVMAAHRVSYPTVEIQCKDIFSTPQNEALRKREIDVGFLRPPIDSAHLDSEVLFQEEFYVVLPRRHPLAKHRTLRLKDVIGEPLIIFDRRYSSGLYDKILDLYRRQGLTPRLTITHTETHEEAGKVMVASGRGIFIGVGAMVNTSVFGVQLAAVRLREPGAVVQICIAWRKQETSAAVVAFLETVRKLFRDGVSPWAPGQRSTVSPRRNS